MSAHRHQRGAALLTALIIVTLIASLAAGMVWQQYRAVQIEAADRARAQSAWILQGALDWARLILREDAQANTRKAVDHLGEPWAVPLAEARLSTFLAADRTVATNDEGPEAFLSGNIEDAQSRYNLRNLLVSDAKALALEQRVLERLCSQVNAPPSTAAVIVAGMKAALPVPPPAEGGGANAGTGDAQAGGTESTTAGTSAEGGPGQSQTQTQVQGQVPGQGQGQGLGTDQDRNRNKDSGPLQPASVDQLSWLGLDADTIKRLQRYVVLLPKATPVNLNTAPREVISALFDGVDLATAERLVQGRKAKPLQDITADLANYLPPDAAAQATGARASATSSFFIVTGRLRLDERQLEQRSLVERQALTMVVLARERVNQLLDR